MPNIPLRLLTKIHGIVTPTLQRDSATLTARSTKMYAKRAALSLAFMIVLVIFFSISIGTVDLRSYFFPLLQSPAAARPLCATNPVPLRVFMYDLPRRFNVGMFNRRSTDQTPVTSLTWLPWPKKSGLKRQHSVEYWMMGSLLYDGDGREVVRVSDPEMAEAFFVPFFSSLSFNTHGHNMTDPKTRIDRQLQVFRLVPKSNIFSLSCCSNFRF